MRRSLLEGSLVLVALASAGLPACKSSAAPEPSAQVETVPVSKLPGHDKLAQDNSAKEGPRMVPAESYMRTYLTLFGGLSPIDSQVALAGTDKQLFDTWNDYLSTLGLPDYRTDLPRGTQVNALMLATFERIGIALCDRSVERDLRGIALDKRLVFAFDLPTGPLDQAGFTQRFDVLHRTFLGYPAALAPAERAGRFFGLYNDTVARHQAAGAPNAKLSPVESGWANVCYGLIRHPEFHLY